MGKKLMYFCEKMSLKSNRGLFPYERVQAWIIITLNDLNLTQIYSIYFEIFKNKFSVIGMWENSVCCICQLLTLKHMF